MGKHDKVRQKLDDDGIVRITNSPGAVMELADAVESIRRLRELGQGKRLPIWVDASEIKSMSRKARRYLSGEEAEAVVLAQAILVSSPVGKIISRIAAQILGDVELADMLPAEFLFLVAQLASDQVGYDSAAERLHAGVDAVRIVPECVLPLKRIEDLLDQRFDPIMKPFVVCSALLGLAEKFNLALAQ